MEARMTLADAPPEMTDHEGILFVGEIEEGMPQGDELGMAEARADYLLERIAAEQQRIDRERASAKARVQMIRDHEAEEIRKLQGRISYLEQKIRIHLPGDAARFRKVYGKKSVSLAHGKVGFKQRQATVRVTDAEKALAFAQANGLQITVKQSVGKTPLIEHVIRTSEEPDPEEHGFEFVPPSDEFYIAPDLEF